MQVVLISSYRNAGAVVAIRIRSGIVAVTVRDSQITPIVPVVARANTTRQAREIPRKHYVVVQAGRLTAPDPRYPVKNRRAQ